jgi:hypothetical protein
LSQSSVDASRASAAASNYRRLKKSFLTDPGDLWNASKSVKVSRDRTVVLTIFWRVSCRQVSANAFGDRRKPSDGDDEIDGQTRSKKTRRVKPLGCLTPQPSMSRMRQHNLTTIGREDRGREGSGK